jgi:hypothetical protein
MSDLACGAGLAFEAASPFRISAELRGKDLHGNIAL